MAIKKHAVLLSLLFATAACAPVDTANTPAPIGEKQAKMLAKELKGKVAGAPVNCISSTHHYDPIRISDDMLLYRVSGRLVYQNKLRGICNGLTRDDDIIVTETFGSQYCRGDIIRLVDRMSGFPGGFCSLGEFTPYRKDDSVAANGE
jgi:hypothetical protein